MNKYFDTLAQALKRYHVDVSEFHADTIMCAWTSDDPQKLDRRNAALASLALVDAVNQFNAQTQDATLSARVGLEEGQFYLGHTGGGGRMGYSILGDCANTAARLESLNKQLGTRILATEPVVQTSSDLVLRPLGQFVLVGKTEPVPVVEIMARADSADSGLAGLGERFAEALEAFGRLEWTNATRLFQALTENYPDDGPSRFFLARCRQYETQPPTNDDPSTIRLDKK
jgi:adenylate cyclase